MKFKGVRLLPMPLSRVRWKLINKTYSNDQFKAVEGRGEVPLWTKKWYHTWLGKGLSLSINLARLI
jgi:hypothetical protein